MRKKVVAFVALVCVLMLIVGVFAACDNDDGGSSGAGDAIFTEDASLEDIVAALENAESLTYTVWMKYAGTDSAGETDSGEATYQYKITDNASLVTVTEMYNTEESFWREYLYRSNGVDYDIMVDYYEDGTETDASKNLDVIDPNVYSDAMYLLGTGTFAEYLTTDSDGNIVVNASAIDGYIEGSGYVKLNGSSIEIGWEYEYSDEYGSETGSHKLTVSGINATTAEIPDEVRALEAEAEWSDYVTYNGVSYEKSIDADGNEYYYVSHSDDGAVPEETINTLPVR